MVVANIADSVILGIYFLAKQRAVINLSDYSIRLNGQNIPPVMINTADNQYVKIYRVKSTKLQSPWKGHYLITTVKPPMLYQIKDRLKLCEHRELPIWLTHQCNERKITRVRHAANRQRSKFRKCTRSSGVWRGC
jgi:hypothetical protein